MQLASRDLVVLSDRQSERVSAIALSADGRTLATGDYDGTIRIRDPDTGRVRAIWQGQRDSRAVGLVAFSPDGRRLASVASWMTSPPPIRSSEVLIWDLDSTKVLASLEGFSDRHVNDIRFAAKGGRLWERSWTEAGESDLRLWDVSTDPGHPRTLWRRPSNLTWLPVTSDGAIVALEEAGRRFVVHDIVKQKELGRTGALDHEYSVATPSPDGQLLAVNSADKMVLLWNTMNVSLKARYAVARSDLYRIWFSPNGRYLGFDLDNGEFTICDLLTGAVRQSPPVVPDALHSKVFAFSPDSRFVVRQIARMGSAQPATVWELDPWRQVATYPGTPEAAGQVYFSAARRIDFHQEGCSCCQMGLLATSRQWSTRRAFRRSLVAGIFARWLDPGLRKRRRRKADDQTLERRYRRVDSMAGTPGWAP